MTQEQLGEALKFWQSALRLKDWDITAEIVRRHKMSNRTHFGEVSWNLSRMSAKILISDEIDTGESDDIPFDPEQTLVHELVHLHVAKIGEVEGNPSWVEEQVVDQIANAFVGLHRVLPHGKPREV